MPSDQFLESFSTAALCLFDKQLLVFRIVNSLCSPLQYGFHGHGFLDARNREKSGGNCEFHISNCELN